MNSLWFLETSLAASHAPAAAFALLLLLLCQLWGLAPQPRKLVFSPQRIFDLLKTAKSYEIKVELED